MNFEGAALCYALCKLHAHVKDIVSAQVCQGMEEKVVYDGLMDLLFSFDKSAISPALREILNFMDPLRSRNLVTVGDVRAYLCRNEGGAWKLSHPDPAGP